MLLVIIFSLIGGIFSLIGGMYLLRSKKSATTLAKYATPFAAGALIAAVFLDLLPEALAEASAEVVMLGALVGIVGFFYLERFLHWFHHHHEHEIVTHHRPASLIVIGDTLHNALDGVAIASAFLVSVPAGIVTTIAVAAHEIPQEIGDFGLLLAKGYSRKKVLIVNIFSALSTAFMAILVYALGSADKLPIGVLLGVSAGFLLYIALSDLIPTIHEESAGRKKLFDIKPLLLLAGIFVVAIMVRFAGQFITE
ncbi:ZIP family metal transporter [Candidatus Saccharibacteria bacterium]|nr:ZIP family metal transporter [Candidatus Saccharibacteria bacterium]